MKVRALVACYARHTTCPPLGHVIWEYMLYGKTCVMEGQVLLEDILFRMACHKECISYESSCFV